MPRRSTAALTLATYASSFGRLQPSADLNGLARELFIEIVASLPPDHFEASDAVLLAAYARCAALERRSAETLQAYPRDADALATHGSAVRSLATLCTRLRLSPQARKKNHRARSTTSSSYYDQMAR